MQSKAHAELMRIFRVLVELEERATKEKRKLPAGSAEHAFWQARADIARILSTEFRQSFETLESKRGVSEVQKFVNTRRAW